jgi:hypothetical protein
MLMELAHRLAVSEQPYIREIRDKLIVLINPAAEPDGRDRMVDWFYRHLKGKTDFENLPPLSPPYWGKYVRHDNNRDGIQRKLALTARDAGRVPQVAAARDARPARVGAALVDLDRDRPLQPEPRPSVFSEWHTIAFQEVATLTAMGPAGRLDLRLRRGLRAGLPGLARDQPQRHQPRLRDLRQRHRPRPSSARSTPSATAGPAAPSPRPTGTGWCRRRRSSSGRCATTQLHGDGCPHRAQFAARNSSEMLHNFWRRGLNAVRKGETEKPYAIAIPEKQDDRGASRGS